MATESIILSSLSAVRNQYNISAGNIAQADTEGYTKKVATKLGLVQNNQPQGVIISGIESRADEYLQNAILYNISDSKFAEIESEYHDRIQQQLGVPGTGGALNSAIDKFFNELSNLATTPQKASNRLLAMTAAQDLVAKIADTAKFLEDLRFSIDQDLANSFTDLNVILNRAFELRNQIMGVEPKTLVAAELQDQLQQALENIAEYFKIQKFNTNNGQLNLIIENGDSLLGDLKYQIAYEAQTFVGPFINDEELNPIRLLARSTNGNIVDLNVDIVEGGKSSEIKNQLTSGKVAALLKMRDVTIPNMLEQLDNLAHNVRTEMNRLANDGVGYPPPSLLTGSAEFSRSDLVGFSGNIRVAVVADDGKAVDVPPIPALDLDLGALDYGSGPGKTNLEGLMQEINYHFNEKVALQSEVEIGGLNNMKLVSRDTTITAGQPWRFDIELTNYSESDIGFTLLDVRATDNTLNDILNSFDANSFNSAGGKIERTGVDSVVINNPNPLDYPYTIELDIEVLNKKTNTTYTSTVTYVIDNPTPNSINGVINKRFEASLATGDANLKPPDVGVGGVLSAYLVDRDGNMLSPGDEAPGRLEIKSANGSWHIAIDNLDSDHVGDITANILPTHEKFSSYYGLNDFFVRTDEVDKWSSSKNAAINMAIREDIIADPNKIPAGKLQPKFQDEESEAKFVQYEVYAGSNESLTQMVEFRDNAVFFKNAGMLPATTITFSQYAAEILAYMSTEAIKANENYALKADITHAVEQKMQANQGVNIDEELQFVLNLQYIYSASAKALGIIKELNQILLNEL
jgi:flagellar hook-associated protein 1 FlgK